MSDSRNKLITSELKKMGINSGTILFFISMVDSFDHAIEYESNTRKLAELHGVSRRTVQNYIKTLNDKFLITDQKVYKDQLVKGETIRVCYKHIFKLTRKSYDILNGVITPEVKRKGRKIVVE